MIKKIYLASPFFDEAELGRTKNAVDHMSMRLNKKLIV